MPDNQSTENQPSVMSRIFWFAGGVLSTFSLTVLLTNFIHPERYQQFRGDNWLLTAWNDIVAAFSIGPLSPILTNAFIAMLAAAIPMFYLVKNSPEFEIKKRRQKYFTFIPLALLPFASILFAGIYKVHRDPAATDPQRSLGIIIAEWGNNLMYGGALGLLVSLAFSIAVIVIVKPYRIAIAITLAAIFIFQIIAALG